MVVGYLQHLSLFHPTGDSIFLTCQVILSYKRACVFELPWPFGTHDPVIYPGVRRHSCLIPDH